MSSADAAGQALVAAATVCDGGNASGPVTLCVGQAGRAITQCPSPPSGLPTTPAEKAAYACLCGQFRTIQGCFKTCPAGLNLLSSDPTLSTVISICDAISPAQTSQSPSQSAAPASSSDGGLSTGAIAGIGAGAALVLLVAIGAAVFFFMRSKKAQGNSAKEPSPAAPVVPPTVMPADASYYSYPSQQHDSQQSSLASSHQPSHNQQAGYHGQHQHYVDPSGQHQHYANPSQQSATSSNEKASGLFANTAPSESQRLPYYATPSQHSNALSSGGSSSQPSQISTHQSYSQYSTAPAPDYQTRMMGPGGGSGGSVAALPGYNPQMANGAAYAAPANEKEYWRT